MITDTQKTEEGYILSIGFGKNGLGLSDELITIGQKVKELSKDNRVFITEAFIDRADDVYQLKFEVLEKEPCSKPPGKQVLSEQAFLNFGQAVEAAKQGKRIARKGWNGANMFAYIVPAARCPAQTGVAKDYFGENALVPYRAYWALKTAQEDVATWAPSGSDTLAEDWFVLD